MGEIELLVLATVEPEGSRTDAIAERLGQSDETVRAAVVRLVQADLLQGSGDGVTLTPRGRLAAANVHESRLSSAGTGVQVPAIDLNDMARIVSTWWPVDPGSAAADDAAQDALLASDADRDLVVRQLADAFAEGRLSSTELEQRTGSALAARSYGELDDVLQGLGGLQRQVKSHPVRRAVFGVVAFLSSPFVMVGGLFLAFGNDVDDHVFGLVLLVLLLPGLVALWRWAWPRR